MSTPTLTAPPPPPAFPPHPNPRVWLITSGPSPIGIAVARAVLQHGDSVVLGLPKSIPGVNESGPFGSGTNGVEGGAEREEAFREFWTGDVIEGERGWRERARCVGLDGR